MQQRHVKVIIAKNYGCLSLEVSINQVLPVLVAPGSVSL